MVLLPSLTRSPGAMARHRTGRGFEATFLKTANIGCAATFGKKDPYMCTLHTGVENAAVTTSEMLQE